ncbi:cyclin N-terminal domain-containing protein 1-like [Ditylenchus destructor]|uniref:Cyclin N-terminal domain-containing protein 1-like n=1 Tax=Ditylenchus destructor TaxID=166010 RepID=A0AAD4NDC3_9BILA|nr:cyclin N-terminal domain-containing protein 1-like [Ditylenchus destructor]
MSNGIETRAETEDETNRTRSYFCEPEFQDRSAGLHPDLWADWMSILVQENRDRVENISDVFRIFVQPPIVQYVFTICLRLRMSHEVKYLALGIFNEFMVAHISTLYSVVINLINKSDEEKQREWEKIESNVSRQLPLRVLSCVQIASKIISHNQALCNKSVRRCLQSLGQSYTEEAVRKSEVRILSTIDFSADVRQNPVSYVESVLHILLFTKNDPKIEVRPLWDYSIIILDCIYLQQDEVYQGILIRVHGIEASNLNRDRIIRLQGDYMLLAGAVVMTACICVHGMDFAEACLPIIGETCFLPQKDIVDTSVGIMKTIVDFREHNNSSHQLLSGE